MPNMKYAYADMEKYQRTRSAQRKRYYDKTAKYPRRSWTNEENKKVLAHAIPDMELSTQIQRSVRAIQIQRSRLKKEEKAL